MLYDVLVGVKQRLALLLAHRVLHDGSTHHKRLQMQRFEQTVAILPKIYPQSTRCVSVSICKQKTCSVQRPSSLVLLTVSEGENKILLFLFFPFYNHMVWASKIVHVRRNSKKESNVVYSILFQLSRHVNHWDANPPADGSLTRNYVTLAIVEAEICLQLTDTLTGQAVHTEVPRVTNALRLP